MCLLNRIESIEWFIEDYAFSPSYDLAPTPPIHPPPLPSGSSAGDTQEDWERETTCWRERGGCGGAKSYDGEKAWSSINHSILSGPTCDEVSKRISRAISGKTDMKWVLSVLLERLAAGSGPGTLLSFLTQLKVEQYKNCKITLL